MKLWETDKAIHWCSELGWEYDLSQAKKKEKEETENSDGTGNGTVRHGDVVDDGDVKA